MAGNDQDRGLKRYHFDCGDTTEGECGYCAAVYARSEEEAVRVLRDALPEYWEIELTSPAVEYLNVYFNFDKHPTKAAIDGIEPIMRTQKPDMRWPGEVMKLTDEDVAAIMEHLEREG